MCGLGHVIQIINVMFSNHMLWHLALSGIKDTSRGKRFLFLYYFIIYNISLSISHGKEWLRTVISERLFWFRSE